MRLKFKGAARMASRHFALAGSLACSLALGTFALAQGDGPGFPPRGDDVVPSLGSFRIYIAPQFRPLLAGYPGYNAGTFRLQSPTMADRMTLIGRSDPHTHGSAPDTGGTPVGSAGTVISDSAFVVTPPGFQGPGGTNEVHTEVRSLNLLDLGGSGAAVRAGTFAPLQPISPGEVESQNTGGVGLPPDFPADSFFDIFCEVDLPPLGAFTAPAVLYNRTPLLVVESPLLMFPPTVIYVHRNSSAVPVYFRNANPPQWNADDLLGWLVLAGHGANFTPSMRTQFEQVMQNQPELDLPVVSPITANGFEGSSSNTFPFTSTVQRRYQQIHADLPPGPLSMSRFSFRGNTPPSLTNYTGTRTMLLDMSIGTGPPSHADVSRAFAANFTSSTQVLTGVNVNWGPQGPTVGTPGPQPFNSETSLVFPTYLWPGGTMTWEVAVYSNTGAGTFDTIDVDASSITNAAATTTGPGCICTGRTGASTLSAAFADIGGYFTMQVGVNNGPTSLPVFLALGTANLNLPYPGLCSNILTNFAVSPFLIGSTSATGALGSQDGFTLGVSNSFAGAQLFFQAHSVDPGQTGLPVCNSSGVSVTVPAPTTSKIVQVSRMFNNVGGTTATTGVFFAASTIGYGLPIEIN